ncbi:hypothetical protein AVEN_201794-1 [Araneus ventricosus]|uniref:Uncharacterized protein n=1 Tax=Araneus ventricosus TaxID=182803 RepID=A0A4Y2KBU1_ARAVE|nr:hypothetical protein AVEN_201794-1 [Araneus ventricosus]
MTEWRYPLAKLILTANEVPEFLIQVPSHCCARCFFESQCFVSLINYMGGIIDCLHSRTELAWDICWQTHPDIMELSSELLSQSTQFRSISFFRAQHVLHRLICIRVGMTIIIASVSDGCLTVNLRSTKLLC